MKIEVLIGRGSEGNMHRAIKISNGLKIKCKEYQLNVLLSEHTITDKFKLNVKRLNRWWYSVYFEVKESEKDE